MDLLSDLDQPKIIEIRCSHRSSPHQCDPGAGCLAAAHASSFWRHGCIANVLAAKRKKPPAPPKRGDEWLKCRGYDLSQRARHRTMHLVQRAGRHRPDRRTRSSTGNPV